MKSLLIIISSFILVIFGVIEVASAQYGIGYRGTPNRFQRPLTPSMVGTPRGPGFDGQFYQRRFFNEPAPRQFGTDNLIVAPPGSHIGFPNPYGVQDPNQIGFEEY